MSATPTATPRLACGLSAEARRLVIEAGFSAAPYGLRRDMHAILAALPDWLDEPEQLARCEALLLFGLGRLNAARTRLASLPDDELPPLRAALTTPQSATQPFRS